MTLKSIVEGWGPGKEERRKWGCQKYKGEMERKGIKTEKIRRMAGEPRGN